MVYFSVFDGGRMQKKQSTVESQGNLSSDRLCINVHNSVTLSFYAMTSSICFRWTTLKDQLQRSKYWKGNAFLCFGLKLWTTKAPGPPLGSNGCPGNTTLIKRKLSHYIWLLKWDKEQFNIFLGKANGLFSFHPNWRTCRSNFGLRQFIPINVFWQKAEVFETTFPKVSKCSGHRRERLSGEIFHEPKYCL